VHFSNLALYVCLSDLSKTVDVVVYSLNTSAKNGTVAKLYLYSPFDLDAVVKRPCELVANVKIAAITNL